MERSPTDKPFDCLAFKRDVQSRIHDDIKDLSPEEQIAYFRRKAAWFRSGCDRGRGGSGKLSRPFRTPAPSVAEGTQG